MLKRITRRPWLLCLLLLLLTSAVTAQGPRTLTPGTPVAGTLNGQNLVQMYVLDGNQGEVVTLSATNKNNAALALTLTDASGTTISQNFDLNITGQIALSNVTLPANGVYYVTVFQSAGVAAVNQVQFTLTLTVVSSVTPASTAAVQATATVAPTQAATLASTAAVTPSAASTASAAATPFQTGQVLTTSGMQVVLTWTTTDDLDLEVRDPVGGSLRWATPTVTSGGTFGKNVNQGCTNTTTSPSETATWSPGGIPTGSYEVLVYYQKACAGGAPATFTVATTVDGKALDPVQGTLSEGQVFVSSFIVHSDGTSELTGLSGVVNDNLPDTAQATISAATPIQFGTALSGTITDQNSYQTYSFQGQANDLITIDMNATSGSLDTFLFLLDASGNVVRSNDDRATGQTDAEISNALLPTAGTYYIVATRYAKRIGGTEGDYSLTVTSQASSLPQAFLNLPRGSLEVRLLWNTAADLQLLVRDASGKSVYVDVPSIPSGGRMPATGNTQCTAPQGTSFSYIYWPTDTPPRPGTYEVQVWYKNQCNDTTPVNFNLYVTYNGKEVISDRATPVLNDRFLTSFTITPDGQTVPSDGGIINGFASLDYQSKLENAIPLDVGTPRNGSITQDNKFDVYVFTAKAGDVISVAMNNTSGTLDPSLYLLDAHGNQVAENDDVSPPENTNSLISNLTLPADGQYIIIATHFGARFGGTTGTYSLTLTKPS